MRDGVAVWSEFRECMGTVLQSVGASAPQATRVYSEAVSVLWGRDQGTAAVLIEKFWNDLRKEYRFSVFCGYRVDALDLRSYQGPVANVGRAHTDVLWITRHMPDTSARILERARQHYLRAAS